MNKPPRSLFYDRDGKPIDSAEWNRRLEGPLEYRVVEKTDVRNAEVSTVWIGLDHNFHDAGPPLIFETMVFGLDADSDNQWRYSTEEQARAGHWAAVKQVQDMLRIAHGSQEELLMPDDSRPIAEVEPGSVDISGLDKAELLAALCNATSAGRFARLAEPVTQERAAALIQDRLGGVDELGRRGPFDFDYAFDRPIKCDLSGPRISAFHVARYDRDAGAGTLARVVDGLRATHERRRAERGPS